MLAVVAVAVLVGAAPAPAAGGYRACAGGYTPEGKPPQNGNAPFFRRIRARKVSCASARRVTKTFIKRYGGRSHVTLRAAGRTWHCDLHFRSTPFAETAHPVCAARGGRRVRFYGAP